MKSEILRPTITLRRTLLAGVLSTSLLMIPLTGCEDPRFTPEQASPFVEQWADQFGPKLKEQIASGKVSEALEAELQEASQRGAKNLNQKGFVNYAALLSPIYASKEYKPVFIKNGELSKKGARVLAQLEQVQLDGFARAPYQSEAITAELDRLKKLKEDIENIGEFNVSTEARKRVLDEILTRNPEHYTLDESKWAELDELFKQSDEAASLREQVERANTLGAEMSLAQAKVEAMLAIGLARYAHEMRYFHHPEIFVYPREDDYYNNPETRSSRPTDAKGAYQAGYIWRHAIYTVDGILDKREKEFIDKKIVAAMTRAITGDEQALETMIAHLSPGPQYDGLKKEYARYTQIAEAGGWPQVPEQRSLRKGAKSEVVKQLKKRLQIEGYFPADKELTTLFDADLVDAVKAYQRTHQMDDDGKPGKTFWRSLNVPAKQRAAQLAGTMKKWRASNIQHHDHETYVLVNLPDFTAEIWDEQERAMRMRVVIGNNDRVRDEESGKLEHANRTPTLSAYIDRIIYNPYWNVTPRIRTNEILVDVRKDLEQVYQAKVDRLLDLGKAPAPDAQPKPATGTLQPTNATTTTTAGLSVTSSPPVTRPYAKSGGQWKLDVAAFQSAYQAKKGAPADLATLFPYLQAETGLIDVSTTDPENIPPWYAKNGYEVMYPGKSWEYVRQLNGPENALGKVKVIFPNMHDVYLHDTPAKALFSKTIRAYSHGCMRMHQPLDFAKWLLENDGQYNEDIERKLANKTYNPVFLKKHVPVHVVYFTTRVDDEGRANFLIDIYDQEPS